MLPPAFCHKNTFTYGKLTLVIQSVKTTVTNILTVEPHFFGSAKELEQHTISTVPLCLEYTVATNLWHFFSYLTDCRTIPLIFTDSRRLIYSTEVDLELLPSSQVLNRHSASIDYLFQKDSYLLSNKQSLKLFDRSHAEVGAVEVSLTLQF